LLSLARQEPRADVVRKRLRFDDLAREVVAEMVPLADARKVDLGISASQPAYVQGDSEALRTLVRNLVDNAVRYTPIGGTVDVSVQNSDAAGSTHGAVLQVIDTGPGIPPDERLRVFDRFYRPPGTSPPGSGLGMAIVKAIADAHGATIVLDSDTKTHGLAVTVSFPFS
jgi:two-component system OmpR family sensor kinase